MQGEQSEQVAGAQSSGFSSTVPEHALPFGKVIGVTRITFCMCTFLAVYMAARRGGI